MIRRLAATALLLLPFGMTACTSGPPPVDNRPYDAQIQAWRTDKDNGFRSADDSPIPQAARAAFAGLAYFPIDARYRIPALLKEDRSGPPVMIELQTSQSAKQRMRRVGTLGFSLDGEALVLTAFADENASDMRRLFVPFTDMTSGAETYKHGRYIELERTPTGLYDLDFNRAYHPFCVYNPNYECPVPPKENRLAVAIRAGERLKP